MADGMKCYSMVDEETRELEMVTSSVRMMDISTSRSGEEIQGVKPAEMKSYSMGDEIQGVCSMIDEETRELEMVASSISKLDINTSRGGEEVQGVKPARMECSRINGEVENVETVDEIEKGYSRIEAGPSKLEPGLQRCTHDFMRTLRRIRWEQEMDWEEEDWERTIESREALEEDLQDFTTPMVTIGSDVVSLYPNLDVDKVVVRIEDEIRRTKMEFSNIDYLEATRYLALNWSQEECKKSKLRRVLPWRRKKRGTRPGITGSGPMGRTRGDQEQWEFPQIKLEDWEKREIVACVIRIAVEVMFKKHYYTFGGRTFHQRSGGPIGLRGTCGVARVVMQIYDRKFMGKLEELGIKIHKMVRYMDDTRTLLPPVKTGWRWVEGKVLFCKKWEEEDKQLSGIERTRRVLAGIMGEVEDYLEFTTESEKDYQDGWLPTLDFAMKISETNQVLFRFWEKPTNSKKTLDRRSSMGENQMRQILTQEMVRRLNNTREDLPKEDFKTIIDKYTQKLINSGHGEDQVRSIVIAGIKGWESKVTRCREEGRRVRRTAKVSKESRIKTKLIGKTTWFKKRKGGAEKDWYGKKGARRGGDKKSRETDTTTTAPKTVIFVEQTPGGELAKRLRELFKRLEGTVGFYIKVVERAGRSVRSLFPLNNLWEGASCGRGEEECVTCYQGGEVIPNCTRQSILYENVCAVCIPNAGRKEQLKEQDLDVGRPALYVGESSRSVSERGREHWA